MKRLIEKRLKFSRALNKTKFWWCLFIFCQFAAIEGGILVEKTNFRLLAIPLLVSVSIIDIYLINFIININLYQHWRGKEAVEKIRKLKQIHARLDRLAPSVIAEISGDAEASEYWKVLLTLNEFRE